MYSVGRRFFVWGVIVFCAYTEDRDNHIAKVGQLAKSSSFLDNLCHVIFLSHGRQSVIRADHVNRG